MSNNVCAGGVQTDWTAFIFESRGKRKWKPWFHCDSSGVFGDDRIWRAVRRSMTPPSRIQRKIRHHKHHSSEFFRPYPKERRTNISSRLSIPFTLSDGAQTNLETTGAPRSSQRHFCEVGEASADLLRLSRGSSLAIQTQDGLFVWWGGRAGPTLPWLVGVRHLLREATQS